MTKSRTRFIQVLLLLLSLGALSLPGLSKADMIDIGWRPTVLLLDQKSGRGTAVSALGANVRYSLNYTEGLDFFADYQVTMGSRAPILHGPSFGGSVSVWGDAPKTEVFPEAIIDTGNFMTADLGLLFAYRRYNFGEVNANRPNYAVDDSGVLKEGGAIGGGVFLSSHYWWSSEIRTTLTISTQVLKVDEQKQGKITAVDFQLGVGKSL